MERERIQRAVTDDGTEIVGRVHGQGPPLVLVHGALADGESEWGELLVHLAHRFTCYVPSTRGRDLSAGHPDLSRQARVGDITAFVDGIGEPVGLVGVSGGGMLALGAAGRTDAVTSVVVHEPVVFEAIGDELLNRFREILAQMRAAVARGRPTEAVERFFRPIATDEEAALLEDPALLEEVARYLSIDLEELQEAFDLAGPSPTDPSVLRRVTAPVLLLHGSKTPARWFVDGARYAAGHLREATVREVDGVGHLGHLTAPETMAGELSGFLATAHQSA